MRKRLIAVALFVWVLAATSYAADDSANVAGTWNFTVARFNIEQTFVLKQDGEKIAGTFAPKGHFIGSGPLEGTVKGNIISFHVTTSHGPDGYKGTVDGDNMEGTVTIGTDTNPVPWTAKRAK
jgi:hypothetical protein